jgi:hypothetical protein
LPTQYLRDVRVRTLPYSLFHHINRPLGEPVLRSARQFSGDVGLGLPDPVFGGLQARATHQWTRKDLIYQQDLPELYQMYGLAEKNAK